MKFLPPILFLSFFLSGASIAAETSEWSLAIEAPFAGLIVEHAVTPNHRVGLSAFPAGIPAESNTSLYGARYQFVTSSGSHRGELGLGVLVDHERRLSRDEDRNDEEIVSVLSVGYRYEPSTGGFQFRAGLAWRPGADSVLKIIPLPYASAGWAF